MTTIAPYDTFNILSPDEVAECMEIGTDLYTKIWNEIVPLYDGQERSEVPDDHDKRCLAKYWDKFTPEEQERLNAVAKKEDDEFEQMLNKHKAERTGE